ncbi:MAG: nickel pincer cofactor biosynthesis protein LarC [Chloroflexota bacterium]|nr:nickel pincer cofactor biosynthesis protein LarC [Chloroflexota bacterium]
MARIAYFDCFSGISGDMTLGALVDAGLDLMLLRTELAKLNVPGWSIEAERVVRYGIAGTRLHVRTEEQQTHRHLSDIAHILAASTLSADVQARALAIFSRLADAEAAVHGTTREQVHFHEVGALDAIVDIVGVVIGLKLLDVDAVYASPLPLGRGWINAAHGRIPVPGPAVLQLLGAVHAPLQPDDTPFELVTPTGAALLAELATFEQPALNIAAAGYGFGGRDIGRLNAVRVWIGEVTTTHAGPTQDQVVLLETNIDDQPGEQLAYVAERLLGLAEAADSSWPRALDVWWTPIGMKKGRSAIMLSVLVRPADEEAIVTTIFRETTSLGLRRQPVERWTCARNVRTVTTAWGSVRVKEQRWGDELLGAAPEYEDCAALARAHHVPLRSVYAAAQEALHAI